MHSLHSILGGIREGDFLASIDLTEAYLHVPIRLEHRQYLRFCYAGRHYQYVALPFGLASAPRTFTKILAVLAAHLRAIPIRIQCYLDDLLIQASSQQLAERDLATTIAALRDHGFSVNLAKCQLVPSTRLVHLGALIDSQAGQVFLSMERQVSIRELVLRIRGEPRVPVLLLSQLLGKMISCLAIVPWARFHARPLQWFLLPFQKAGTSSSKTRVRVPPRVLRSLGWWISGAIEKGCHFREPHRVTVTSDASLFGWGGHCDSRVAQGRWSRLELSRQINWLELRAARLVLQAFLPLVRGQHVLLLTDNTTTKAHINRQGGTRSRSLMLEAETLCHWAESHLLSLTADHIAGTDNVQADWLSRATVDPSEWRLHPSLFAEIVDRLGRPVMDLFASPLNTHLPRFLSRFPAQGAEGVDALRTTWPRGLLYAFPPLPLIPAVIRKLLLERAEVVLVAPHWPRRPWFADLVGLSVAKPWRIPPDMVALSQGPVQHPDPQRLQLAVWRLSGDF